MKVKMLLFPSYVRLGSARSLSPNLFALLESLEEEHWDGVIANLPVSEEMPMIVRASSVMGCCKWSDLAQKCAEHGYFVFYDDAIIEMDGSKNPDIISDEVTKFIDRFKATESE